MVGLPPRTPRGTFGAMRAGDWGQ
ncbi:hypothetical protein RV134_320055 [Roseovarius sp. EC-HK134]|nr:hypothetical protein RV420_370010 [Roseovarius sp. EC-SD190]VVT22838.1 hypothetical protein RV134_320055 [Roseovarius sp. EC-HK134]